MEDKICSKCGSSSFYKRTLKYSMEKHAVQFNCKKCGCWFIENEILIDNKKVRFIQPGNKEDPPESFEKTQIPSFFVNRLARKISERYLNRKEREEYYVEEDEEYGVSEEDYEEEDEEDCEVEDEEDCEAEDNETNIGANWSVSSTPFRQVYLSYPRSDIRITRAAAEELDVVYDVVDRHIPEE